MRHISIAFIAVVLFLGLAMGCAPIIEGKKIDGSQTKNLLAEGTTAATVVQMFGEPQEKENLASGETKYVYYYRLKKRLAFFGGGEPQEQQRLEVFIKNNRVERYRYVDAGSQPITTDIPPLAPEKK